MGVLLAGGQSRRFGGRPKGLAQVEGVRIADRVLAALGLATSRQLVVANDPHAATWFPGRLVVPDAVPGLGPLAGLASAIAAGAGSAVLVVAWDMPFITAALLRALRGHGERHAVSCAPVHGAGGTIEPLCAYYRPGAGDVARALLDAGERRAHALFDALSLQAGALPLPAGELARHGDVRRLFRSVDSATDLAELAELAGDGPKRTTPG